MQISAATTRPTKCIFIYSQVNRPYQDALILSKHTCAVGVLQKMASMENGFYLISR